MLRPGRNLLNAVLTLTFFAVLSGSALASEYPLESVSFLTEQEVASLKKLSMKTTADAGARLAGPRSRQEIAKTSGIAVARLTEIASNFDLMRVRGIGAKMAQLINGSSIVDCVGLAAAVPEALLGKMRAMNNEKGIASKMPDVSTLGHWIKQAGDLPAQFLP